MAPEKQVERRTAGPDSSRDWRTRAWVFVALIPVLFFVSMAEGYVLYDLLGYAAEDSSAPLAVDLVVAALVLAVGLAPCAGAVVCGVRSHRLGDRRGLVPLAVGAIVGLALTVLTVVTTVVDALA